MLTPLELVQFDIETAEPVRDKQGFCIPVETGKEVRKTSLDERGVVLLPWPEQATQSPFNIFFLQISGHNISYNPIWS